MLALFFFVLSVRTLRYRRRLHIPVGDGGNTAMLRAMRVHGNFAEYTPIGLLLIAACEFSGAPDLLVHGLGILLLVSRLIHAFGLSKEAEVFTFRVTGMALTFTSYLVAVAFLLLQAEHGST
nr:MAPEG family protein [Telluria aromaticivorans]